MHGRSWRYCIVNDMLKGLFDYRQQWPLYKGKKYKLAIRCHFFIFLLIRNLFLVLGHCRSKQGLWAISTQQHVCYRIILKWQVQKLSSSAISIDNFPTDTLLYVLDKWIAMRTVSGALKHMEECRRGARFLKNVLQQLGAESRMVKNQKKPDKLRRKKTKAREKKLHSLDPWCCWQKSFGVWTFYGQTT